MTGKFDARTNVGLGLLEAGWEVNEGFAPCAHGDSFLFLEGVQHRFATPEISSAVSAHHFEGKNGILGVAL